MRAKQYAPTSLLTSRIAQGENTSSINFRFNGTTDANYGYTVGGHQTHDLGEAMDLGINDFVSYSNQGQSGINATPAVTIPANTPVGWSNQRAVDLSALLNSSANAGGANNQQGAARDFFALYWATQNDLRDTSAGNRWVIVNGNSDSEKGKIQESLFRGSTSAATSLIGQVHIGGTTRKEAHIVNGVNHPVMRPANSYPEIRKVLTQLGILSSAVGGHEHHFHIYLQPPSPYVAPQNLETFSIGSFQTVTPDFSLPTTYMVSVSPAVVIAGPKINADVGLCRIVSSLVEDPSSQEFFLPGYDAKDSVFVRADDPAKFAAIAVMSITVASSPKHGTMIPSARGSGDEGGAFRYDVDRGYFGDDKATFVVELSNGKKVLVRYLMSVVDGQHDVYPSCPVPPSLYKQLREIYGPASGLNSGSFAGPAHSEGLAALVAAASGISLRFESLSGSAIAQTRYEQTNASIVLDPSGAGHGWFIDPTLSDNSEFLPMADSNVWKSRAGTDAEGKMDMLSVLLHEYGHVLGFKHSTDPRDFMSPSLQPGERRLPTAAELTLMSRLVVELKADSALTSEGEEHPSDNPQRTPDTPVPTQQRNGTGQRLARRGNSNSARTGPTDFPATPQYEGAVNPTLLNGDFGADGTQWWVTQGAVQLDGDAATLAESMTRQTHLAQGFMVNAGDRALGFTVSNRALLGNGSGPSDAFEVALLDANTGLPVAGHIDLTLADALLNDQIDSNVRFNERLASSVRKSLNADGSTTYLIDLPAALAGTPVYLSFDLLGFGAAQSHVSLRDIRIVRGSLANTDSVSLDEDSSVTGNVLANDVVLGTTAQPDLVTSAAHGSVVLAADGGFTYRPAADYFGADSFTYRFNEADGTASNTATVNLTVRAINDAPTAIDSSATVHAGQFYTFDPLAGASDVEGSPLSVLVESGPAHGSLAANADGTYSYVAKRSYAGDDSFSYRASDGELSSVLATVRFTVLAGSGAPVARDVALQLLEDNSLRIDPTALGLGTEGDRSISAATIAQPTHGTLVVDAGGLWLYTPSADFNGTDALRFTLSDAGGVSNVATLTLQVTPVNDAPTLVSQAFTVAEDGSITLDLLSGASDVDGDALTAAIVTQPAHGTLAMLTDGSFSYSPAARYVGGDSFRYRVNDGVGDSNVVTVALTITPVNDAPVAADSLAAGTEDTALTLRWSDFAVSDAQGTALTVVITALPAEGLLQRRQADGGWVAVIAGDTFDQAQVDAGKLRFASAAAASGGAGHLQSGLGNRHAHYARIGYTAFDGELSSTQAQVVIDIAAVADLPTLELATPGAARGLEDTAVTLQGVNAALTDSDGSETLVLTLTGLPLASVLSDGAHRFTATAEQRVLNLAGWNLAALQFTPPHDFNGTVVLQLQASAIEGSTGERATATQDIVIEVQAVADAPQLALTARDASVSREIVATGWERAANPAPAATVVTGSSFEGWTLVAPRSNRSAAFEVWASGDHMPNAVGNKEVVYAAPGNGSQWLGLTNGAKATYQTLGIERTLATLDGALYTLTLDYAGGLGRAVANTRIGVYLDGERIGSHAGTSTNTALNWQPLSFAFAGNGGVRKLTIQLEGGDGITGTRAAMIDGLRVVETLPDGVGTVYGVAGTAIALPQITAKLADTSGSERLAVELLGLPAGSVLSDGVRSFRLSQAGQVASLSGWNLSRLDLLPPTGFTGTLQLQVRAISTETSNGASATLMQSLTVTVLAGVRVATPAGVNPYVTLTTGAVSTSGTAGSATMLSAVSLIGVTAGPLVAERGQVSFSSSAPLPPARTPEEEAQAEIDRSHALSDTWLAQLEQRARAQWKALMGTQA